MTEWIGITLLILTVVIIEILYCWRVDTTPTPGSDRERDCPGIPGKRAGCPDRNCRGRHA